MCIRDRTYSAPPVYAPAGPSAQMQPMHSAPAVQAPHAAEQASNFQASLIAPTQVQHGQPPIHRVSSTVSRNSPALPKYQNQMQQNFGGSWGQRVNGPATIPVPDALTAGAQLLELPGKNESYELWPGSDSSQAHPMMDANNAVGVATTHHGATQLLPVSNKPAAALPVIAPAVR